MNNKIKIESFTTGFERKTFYDVQNAIYISNQILTLNFPIKFNTACRTGVESLELNGLLCMNLEASESDYRTYLIGTRFRCISSEDLRLMALYLWNGGKSDLFDEERVKAKRILKDEFGF